MTGLMSAAKYGHTATVQAMLKAGANWKLKDSFSKTALSYAERRYCKEAVKVLRAHGATF